MFKKIIAMAMTVVMALASCAIVMADANVSMNITVGVGETKSLDNYLKSGGGAVSWSNSAPGTVKVNGTSVTGVKAGSAVVSGSANGVSYEFKIKVLKNFSGYQDISTATGVVNNGKNSRGETINHYERYLMMGVKDTIPLTNMLDSSKKYYNYRWIFSDKNIASIKQGKITGLKTGIVHITATEHTNIYDFYVTVTDNCVAKEIKVKRNSLTNLANYLGDDTANYVFSVEGLRDAAIGIRDNKYIEAGESKGISLLKAESTTGGTNFTFVVTIIG